MNGAFSPVSPGLRVMYPQPEAPSADSTSATLSIMTLYAETLAEESSARAFLSARVDKLEVENLALRTALATLSARFDAHLCQREDAEATAARSHPLSVSRTIPRPSSTPIRTL